MGKKKITVFILSSEKKPNVVMLMSVDKNFLDE